MAENNSIFELSNILNFNSPWSNNWTKDDFKSSATSSKGNDDLPNVYLTDDKLKEIEIGKNVLITFKVEGVSAQDWGGEYIIELKTPTNVKLTTRKFQAEKGWVLKTYINSDTIGKSQIQIVVNGVNKNTIDLKFFDPHCVCFEGWATIASIISKNNFIGWGHQGVTENCFDYAWEELKKAGYTLVSPSWRDWSSNTLKISNGIFQTYTSQAVAGLPVGVQKNNFIEGIKYLKDAIKSNIPVLVGVDDGLGAANPDEVTDHFVIIVGMGTDEKGNYFLFHDNATGNEEVGASAENKLYCDCENLWLKGNADSRNTYAQNAGYDYYLVTQIRKSKKK